MSRLTITQVSEKYGINANTLRYYERIGLLPPVPRQKMVIATMMTVFKAGSK